MLEYKLLSPVLTSYVFIRPRGAEKNILAFNSKVREACNVDEVIVQ